MSQVETLNTPREHAATPSTEYRNQPAETNTHSQPLPRLPSSLEEGLRTQGTIFFHVLSLRTPVAAPETAPRAPVGLAPKSQNYHVKRVHISWL